jgi:hypothetical protein
MTTEIVAEKSRGLVLMLCMYDIKCTQDIGSFVIVTFKHPVNKEYFFKQLNRFNND